MLEDLGHNILQFLNKQVLELEVVMFIFTLPRKLLLLVLHVSVILIHKLLPPVDHEDSLEEGIGCPRDTRGLGPDEGRGAELDEVGQLAAGEQDGGVVDKETLADPNEIIQQVGVALHLFDLVHVADGDFAETDKHCPEVISVLLVLVEDCNCDFQEVGVGADGEAGVGLHHGSIERVDELSEAKFKVPHDDFQQLDHAFNLWIFVVLDVAGIADGINDEREGVAGETDDDVDVGLVIGDHF